jgi:hypothetical protein
MDSTTETMSLLYIALACAAGGKDLLDNANQILLDAINSGAISRADTRRAVRALIATTSSRELLH